MLLAVFTDLIVTGRTPHSGKVNLRVARKPIHAVDKRATVDDNCRSSRSCTVQSTDAVQVESLLRIVLIERLSTVQIPGNSHSKVITGIEIQL